MAKELVISAPAHERRVAILEEGQLVEIYIEREKEFALVGSIYKGRVTRVLPGMQSAFVDIGLDGDAFLYVRDVFENLEEYEPAGTQAEAQAEAPPAAPALPEREAAPHEALPPQEAEAHAEGEGQPQENIGNNEAAHRQQSSQPRPEGGRGNEYRGGSDRGGDRGGRGRWGRRGGRHHGGRGPERGRNLPPSKYASPQGSEPRPFEPRPFEPRGPEQRRPEQPRFAAPSEAAVGGEEPIVLPGESLAKYRGRTPATMLPPDEPVNVPSEPRAEAAETTAPAVETAGTPQRSKRSLPSWLLANTEADAPAESAPGAGVETTDAPAVTRAENSLTEEDVVALAAQLAEAKHEETQAEAKADAVVGGAVFEEENGKISSEEVAEEEAAEMGEALGEPILEPGEEEELTEEEAREEQLADAEEQEAEASEAHDQAHAEAEAEAAGGGAPPLELKGDLLPGETRSPQRVNAPVSAPPPGEEQPREEPPRDSARIGGDPRARFQRPQRGGRDRGGPGHGRRGDRGGRPRPGFERRPQGGPGGHAGPSRRPQLISEMLKAGQEVIVQIAKEPLGKKGARITSHVALPGRFLVYMPTIDHVGVSRKIGTAENRSRLRRLVSEAKGSFPGGFIVRTAAGEATDEEVRADIEFLGHTWNEIKKRGEDRKAPALLHRDLSLVERILRDYVNDEYTAIWIDNEEEYGKVVEFVNRFQPKMVSRVKLYTKEAPIFEEFGIQHDLDKALRPKVWLKSGGYIVINHTEALVAIDVNTGKYVGRGSTRLEDTIVKTNLEAVKEIVRQIRLRDLGGIIVVDFIDMEERRNREKVMFALQQALDQDKAPSKALGFNEFGLVAITRKRTKQALERVLCQPCPSCSGSGMVKSVPTLCYEIQAEARKMATDQDSPNLTLRVHPEIAKALKTREAMLVDELEQTSHKHVIIQSDATLHWEQYDIY